MPVQHTPIKNMTTNMNGSLIDIEDERIDFGRQVNTDPNANASGSHAFSTPNDNGNDIISHENFILMRDNMSELMQRCEQLQTQLAAQNNNRSNAPINNTAENHKLSLKFPIFHADKPDLWFCQVEAQFRNNRITRSQTKYDHVVASLDPKYLDVIAHIIRDPPAQEPYEKIKSILIKEFQHSDEARLKTLLQGINLGDLKPSVLLRQMRETSKNMISDIVLETLWSSKLPETLRAIIACMNVDLDEKAQKADKILDRSNFETSTISHANQSTPISNANSVQSCELTAQIAALTKQVSELANKFNDRSRTRSRSQSRSRSNSNSNKNDDKEKKKYDQCWFHFKFNDDAKKCYDWCKHNAEFKQKN